jgi:hypothetical protein
MTLAADYPLLEVFLTTLYFFLFIVWIMLLFYVIADIFRSHEMSGWGKAGWLLLIFVLPMLGVLIYLIARGNKMAEHRIEDAQAQDAAFRAYVKQAAGSSAGGAGGGPGDQLAQLASLRDSGIISEAEFEQGKAKILA